MNLEVKTLYWVAYNIRPITTDDPIPIEYNDKKKGAIDLEGPIMDL